jgi:hypothetical protein
VDKPMLWISPEKESGPGHSMVHILTHTNNQTKVVRKFKKEHKGNYYEVIDDIVDGGEP